jgi:hypothetical protein
MKEKLMFSSKKNITKEYYLVVTGGLIGTSTRCFIWI